MAKCFVMNLKAICMLKRSLCLAFSTAVDISDDEGGMAMDILFKPRVEATEQMAQNCMYISLSKNQRERKIMSK